MGVDSSVRGGTRVQYLIYLLKRPRVTPFTNKAKCDDRKHRSNSRSKQIHSLYGPTSSDSTMRKHMQLHFGDTSLGNRTICLLRTIVEEKRLLTAEILQTILLLWYLWFSQCKLRYMCV